jgi:predicted nucleotidyltransferase component of viral defense system
MTAPEWEAVAEQFGVEPAQVRRDHLISHVLAAIARAIPDGDLVFFGGTALARTQLIDSRLSEDIDLICLAPRSEVSARIQDAVRAGVLRTHGRPTWTPELTTTRDAQSAVLSVPDGTSIQIQLIASTGYPAWPTEVADLHQRYSDAPPARMRVLTPDAFVAAKMTAWLDRRTPRDLYDLAALADGGLISTGAIQCFARHGPTSKPLPARTFRDPPAPADWERALAHQTRLTITAAEALGRVGRAWKTASKI